MNFNEIFLPFLLTISFTLIQSSGFELTTDGDSVAENDKILTAVDESQTLLDVPCLVVKNCRPSNWANIVADLKLAETSKFERVRHKRELRMKTTILSPRVTTVQRGSILNLLCVVSEHEKPPKKIVWVINGTTLDFQFHRGGVHLEVIKQKRSTTSKLTINDFHQEDGGAYECRAGPQLRQGYNNHVMEPSYRDAVEVKVVEQIVKKELFSDSGSSSIINLPRVAFILVTTATAISSSILF